MGVKGKKLLVVILYMFILLDFSKTWLFYFCFNMNRNKKECAKVLQWERTFFEKLKDISWLKAKDGSRIREIMISLERKACLCGLFEIYFGICPKSNGKSFRVLSIGITWSDQYFLKDHWVNSVNNRLERSKSRS